MNWSFSNGNSNAGCQVLILGLNGHWEGFDQAKKWP